MSIKSDRISIYPSRASQLQIKIRLVSAQKGHAMLKKKADALQLKFRSLCLNLANTKSAVQKAFKDANYSIARAKFIGADFETIILQSVRNAQVYLKSIEENIAGVSIVGFQYAYDDDEPFQFAGLSRGGQQIIEVRKLFQDLTKLLVEMASLEIAHNDLKNNITTLSRRINSIQYNLIPKLVNTLNYIESELDEIEREEFYRLKKIQNKKRKKFIDYGQAAGDGLCKKASSFTIDFFCTKDEDKDILF